MATQRCDKMSIAEYKNFIEHRRAARKHAQKRFKERFDIELTARTLKYHENLIYTRNALIVGYQKRQGVRITLHEVVFCDRSHSVHIIAYAVFNWHLRCICTYLPNMKNWSGSYC